MISKILDFVETDTEKQMLDEMCHATTSMFRSEQAFTCGMKLTYNEFGSRDLEIGVKGSK